MRSQHFKREHLPLGVLAAMLSSSLASGCATAPSVPPRTTVAVPSSTTSVEETEGKAPPPQWWHLYREPALDALVEEALTNNRDLRAAEANLLRAQAILGQARADTLPQTAISTGAGYGSTLQDQIAAAGNDGSAIRTGGRFDLGADLAWEPDLFGRLRSTVRAARADARMSAALEDEVRVVVAAGVTGAWLDACGFARRGDVARQSLALAERGRELLQRLRAVGSATPADVLRADTLVAQTRAAIPMLDAGRQDALAELAVLAGRSPTDVPSAATACRQLPIITAIGPMGDGAALLRRRPDVRAAEQKLTASTARIGVAVADLYPRIVIGGMVADSSPTPGGLGDRINQVWRVGPLLSWSFPNSNAARARLRAARADEAAALAAFDGVILAALKEIRQRATDYAALLRRQDDLRTAVERSLRAERLMELQRAAGAATALEALEAERAAIEAQSAAAQADSDIARAQVALFKALGGGWENAPAVRMPTPDRSSLADTPFLSSK
ncbi:efflux transporter outer membrane subunit [Sphingomonas morindae]|uniref:TolC family protein n=1 Tax=Sphingomonas morindae TaxID=1541170 RepID=A0ABY4XDZ0_9SPHN|nr:TolC family protein [Sphingomonas morindae]USI75175.1 TolC family protein [Sphingomonas morindae]